MNVNDVLRERRNKMPNRKKTKKQKKHHKDIHEHYCSQKRRGRESHFNSKEKFNTQNDITKTSYDDTAGST